MSGVLGFVIGGVADRLIPVLQTPVEDIIYEVLDQKGLPTRAEVRDLRNKLDRLEKTLTDLTSAFESLKEQADKAADDAEVAREAAEAAGSSTAARKKAPVAAPKKKASAPAAEKACKIDDCGKSVRAKGFCAAHYQKFKRNTLDGFVNTDGSTISDNVRYRVGEEYAGQPVLTSYDGDEVLFLLPEAGGKSLRLKVNDVRID